MRNTSNMRYNGSYSLLLETLSVGFLYLLLGVIFFALLCCCFYIMLKRKRAFRINSSQQYHAILQQIILADAIQVFFSGIVSGVFVLVPDISNVHWLSTACGALACGAWFLYSISANLLAFNRFVHIVHRTGVDQIFSTKLTHLYLAVLYTYSILWTFVLASPQIAMKFSQDHNSYVCGVKDDNCFWMSRGALVFDCINVVCICVFYTIICMKVRSEVKNQARTLNQMRQIRSEAKVVYQSLLICLGSITYIFIFFLPIHKDKLTKTMTHLIWISLSGINSVILLTMNSTMKEQFRLVVKRNRPAISIISIRIRD